MRSDRFLNEGYYPLPCFDSKRQVSEYFQYLALTVSLAVLQLNVAFHTVTALFTEADAYSGAKMMDDVISIHSLFTEADDKYCQFFFHKSIYFHTYYTFIFLIIQPLIFTSNPFTQNQQKIRCESPLLFMFTYHSHLILIFICFFGPINIPHVLFSLLA